MLEELLISEAKHRAHIFKNLDKYLRKIAEIIKEIDKEAQIYLFGSVAEKKHLLSSDIDILVVTDKPPGLILSELWKKGIKDPFEIHVITKTTLKLYARRAKLVKIK